MPLASLIIVFLTASLAGCASRQTIEAPRSSDTFHRVTIGLCEDYPEESRSIANARRDFEVLKTNNVRVLRIAFGWDAMEPEPGQYDWSFWDDFVRIATEEYGIRLIPYVCYTPRWASASEDDDFWRHPPRDNDRFAQFMKQIVTRYRDRIHSWELWNEPDNPAYWKGSPEQFAALLKAGSRAVREADPRATVVFGGLAWNLNFLQDVANVTNSLNGIDVINLHNYSETWAAEPLETLPDYVGQAHDQLRQRGDRQAIWMAEVGYSSFRRGAHVSEQYRAWFQHEHTPEAQAASVFRVHTLLLASGKVPLIAWYRINDLPETQEVIGDVNNRHLGVLDQHGRPKPALRALRFFGSLFSEDARCIDDQVRLEKTIGAPAEVHAFEKADGTVIVIGWLRTFVPGTRGENNEGDRQDDRATTIRLTLPFSLENSVRVFDHLGNFRRTISLSRKAGGLAIEDLILRNGDVSVVIARRGR